jgi:ubiquinone/menaquinone biosynthesis C-methylase UbiE
MSKKKSGYSLETVDKVYSYWGKSVISYKLGVSFFGYDSFLRRKAVEELHLKKGNTILDLACGPGIMFKRLEKEIGAEGKLIAVDYVAEMIKQCQKLVKKKKWQNVKLIQQDAAELKLKKNSIDAVISVVGVSAIPEHKKALRNCHSALKKGGRLVILDGKDFNQRYRLLTPLLRLLRWSKSYERKELIKDIKDVFGNISVHEYLLGSTFIAVAVKQQNPAREARA